MYLYASEVCDAYTYSWHRYATLRAMLMIAVVIVVILIMRRETVIMITMVLIVLILECQLSVTPRAIGITYL